MKASSAHRMYYVAIVCPQEVDEKVLQFKHWMRDRFGCIVALKSPAHITLVPPFWFDETKETELLQLLRSFTHNIPELEIQLVGFSHFGKKVLFISIKEDIAQEELRNRVETHFMQLPGNIIRKQERPFHPHITIANRDMSPHDFFKAWEYFSKKDFTATFVTTTISLLKLDQGKWNVLARQDWTKQD